MPEAEPQLLESNFSVIRSVMIEARRRLALPIVGSLALGLPQGELIKPGNYSARATNEVNGDTQRISICGPRGKSHVNTDITIIRIDDEPIDLTATRTVLTTKGTYTQEYSLVNARKDNTIGITSIIWSLLIATRMIQNNVRSIHGRQV